jgi:hypothetical protein
LTAPNTTMTVADSLKHAVGITGEPASPYRPASIRKPLF